MLKQAGTKRVKREKRNGITWGLSIFTLQCNLMLGFSSKKWIFLPINVLGFWGSRRITTEGKCRRKKVYASSLHFWHLYTKGKIDTLFEMINIRSLTELRMRTCRTTKELISRMNVRLQQILLIQTVFLFFTLMKYEIYCNQIVSQAALLYSDVAAA